ncbi:head decoration protein [Chitinimonas arctica]|uniref:Head decoration protein n=1 Tax=Chitinimonas arctica TaxID=2594795 RepID=A0A516SJH5_9NEIS|nr:head decoration protein [Chitinimonas arctica]QDQ28296.1 head decoration protein [Chitinimonas arctica]
MRNIKVEGNHTGEYLLSEGQGNISREAIVVAAGPFLPAGQVLGIKTVGGEYVPYNNAANDGSEVAVGILYAPLPESIVPRRAVGHVRLCEVSAERLTGLDVAGRADLKARNVIVR